MNKDLIVAIFVPIQQGDGMGKVGTGYPVAEDLILTSRHVVQPSDRDFAQPIRVRWFYDKRTDDQLPAWNPIEEDDLLWVGQGQLDAALLRCPRPAYLRRYASGRLSPHRPVGGRDWESSGFAKANKCDVVREPGEFSGKVRSMAEGAKFFEVTEIVPPDKKNLWAGASGMPVFVGTDLMGVVKCVPSKYKHKKLQVVPAWRLLGNKSFSRALGLDEQRERLERASKLLEQLLARSDSVTRELARALSSDLIEDPIQACRQALVAKLLNGTLEALFDKALEVQTQRRDCSDGLGVDVIRDLVLTVMPAIHDAAIVTEVRRRKGDVTYCPLVLPSVLPTLAEIIMAGADRRKASVRPAPGPQVFPKGEACLPEPPESGRDADGNQYSEDWSANLIAAFKSDLPGFQGKFLNYLKERFIQSELRSEEAAIDQQDLLDGIADELRDKAVAKDNALTYYFIAEMPMGDKARSDRESVLRKLKQQFPDIAFLRLAGAEHYRTDRQRYGRLRDLLYEKRDSKS